ncbi:septal ring factor EnvC (AmiA/AmiB activator) [Negativicoccus succinicivorans]|uniref:Septal ring factor EnvC (AmiA/AmiB activator) n=1 Tax=Negativicoccus succinicivorans TaxID=620903 RepID=A0A841R618_9FIRM|nr:hypothetical protein [Negativicoccus succinicivorans]MBB6478218.1 septal ring factor EnvC (AmiA/AmiB activator) [Negativicoccus succinicivorans]
MQRKRLLYIYLPLLLAAFLFGGFSVKAAPVTLTAEEWQTLTSELSALEMRTNERQQLINELKAASGGLNKSNNNLKAELERLKMLQIEQRRSLMQTETALKESEQSLIQWKKEELKKRTSLEYKKRAWQIIAVAAVIAAAVK